MDPKLHGDNPGRNQGYDPLIAAGRVSCSACASVAYATDARWATDDGRLLLATYPAACEHTQAITWLIDLDTPARPRMWCHERTRTTGDPCRNKARDGGPCHLHRGS